MLSISSSMQEYTVVLAILILLLIIVITVLECRSISASGVIISSTLFGILFILPLFFLVLGINNDGNCPLEPLLPHGFAYFGVFGLFCCLLCLIFMIIGYYKTDDSGTHLYYFLYMLAVLGTYSLVALLWALKIAFIIQEVYSRYQYEDSSESTSYCQKWVFLSSVYYSASVIILAMVVLILFIGRCCSRFISRTRIV